MFLLKRFGWLTISTPRARLVGETESAEATDNGDDEEEDDDDEELLGDVLFMLRGRKRMRATVTFHLSLHGDESLWC
jgi:hypothetical protein